MLKYITAEFYCQLFYYIFQKNFSVTFPQGYSQKTKIFSRCYLGKKYVPRSGAASCNTAHLIQSTKRPRGRIGEKIIYKKKLFHQITVLCSLQRVLASFLALKTSLTALEESDLTFIPLSPKCETKLHLIWNKYQTFTPIAHKFLEQVAQSFKK